MISTISCPPFVRSSFEHRTQSWPRSDESTDLSDFPGLLFGVGVLENLEFSEFFEYQAERSTSLRHY